MKSYVWWPLIILYLLCVGVRVAAVRNGNFPFWFDVGRDAILSREIVEKRDLKIQGPSASGTQDTVYHGVLYYYVIGPLYTAFHGDPQLVLYALIGLTSLAVVPVVLLAGLLSGSRLIGYTAGGLYVFSYDAIRANTWLSNPSLASLTLPLFFYLLWLVFFEKKYRWFPVLTFILALSQQSVIFFGLLWASVALAAWMNLPSKKYTSWAKQYGWQGILSYLVGVSTMILTEIKIWQAGLLSAKSLTQYADMSAIQVETIFGTLKLILTKVVQSLFPAHPLIAVVVFVAICGFLMVKVAKPQRLFLLIYFISPLWLLSIHFRDMFHSFIGLEALAMVAFAWWLGWLSTRVKSGKVIAVVLVGLFLMSNYKMWALESERRVSMYFVPNGTYYHDLIAAVDYTYQTAAGQPFSISTITNPYGYNSMWAYLYSTYGQDKYGYTPSWYGPDQTGIFGGELLSQTQPQARHFSIEEPPPGIPIYLYEQFRYDQTVLVATSSATTYFGTLRVDNR
jgi:hypothetical protein